MKKLFFLLGAGALLTACDSGYHPDGPDQANAAKQPAAAEQPASALNPDSASNAKLAAVTNQMQVDTSASKIGTAPTGTPSGKGAQLMASADCASCHREGEKLLGPAYKDIAAKYPNTPASVAMLGKKIITGGKGNWGDIAMTPHPALSEGDAKEMVRYILTLK